MNNDQARVREATCRIFREPASTGTEYHKGLSRDLCQKKIVRTHNKKVVKVLVTCIQNINRVKVRVGAII